jgi:hypothetical protein
MTHRAKQTSDDAKYRKRPRKQEVVSESHYCRRVLDTPAIVQRLMIAFCLGFFAAVLCGIFIWL